MLRIALGLAKFIAITYVELSLAILIPTIPGRIHEMRKRWHRPTRVVYAGIAWERRRVRIYRADPRGVKS